MQVARVCTRPVSECMGERDLVVDGKKELDRHTFNKLLVELSRVYSYNDKQ